MDFSVVMRKFQPICESSIRVGAFQHDLPQVAKSQTLVPKYSSSYFRRDRIDIARQLALSNLVRDTIPAMQPQNDGDTARDLLRHALATLAYRAGKTFRNAPEGFANFRISETSRTPGQILGHLADLMDWALSIARGKESWHHQKASVVWNDGVNRFFAALQKLDDFLATAEPLPIASGKFFQGAIADALTHVGQIAMLRRLAGSPIRGENYFAANIAAGRVGANQSAPVYEFD